MEGFPKNGEHEMGHVIQLHRPGLTRGSMKKALESFVKWTEEQNAKKQTER
jgi:hypothetical protein